MYSINICSNISMHAITKKLFRLKAVLTRDCFDLGPFLLGAVLTWGRFDQGPF